MEYPEKLRPYIFHGLRLHRRRHHEWLCDCPFCDKEDHFSINDETGLCACLVCGIGLNVFTFIRKLHEISYEATRATDYQELADQIGLLDIQSLVEWQIAKSIITGQWLIPGYNPQGTMVTLYCNYREDGRHVAKPTSTLGHQIHGMNLWDKDKPMVYICEGWKDAITLWECLTKCKNSDGNLVPTASRESSLYAQANVIAVAGAQIFYESWLPLFAGKVVNLMYDSDHPRKNKSITVPGAGWIGMERATRLMANSKYRPQEVNCVYWGENGFNPNKKSGYDLRDFLTEE